MGCCGNSKFGKYIWLTIALAILVAVIFSLTSCGKKEKAEQVKTAEESKESQIQYYTCGMHPSVKISPEEYNMGNVNCPICNMKLTPVYREEAKAEEEIDELKGVVSRVKIKGEQTQLAGVRTEPAKKLHLYKEIRTVGKVAYDPQLAIAQEEFISSLKALDKILEGRISEIKERAKNLVESSERKLRLLGLSQEQIKELEKTREVQTNLILPEKKMWIYGDVYEYELGWVKVGQKVKVTTSGLPGEEFNGVISSVNPVLDPKTRSVKFRAEVNNPDLKLKPEMYVDVVIISLYLSPDGEHMVLAIPKDAVLDTGTRKIVWIYKENGEYEGREVQVGPEATSAIDGKEAKFYPVLKGLGKGELVVTKANFLIDSQSQITGVSAAVYGGALGVEEKKAPPVHQH